MTIHEQWRDVLLTDEDLRHLHEGFNQKLKPAYWDDRRRLVTEVIVLRAVLDKVISDPVVFADDFPEDEKARVTALSEKVKNFLREHRGPK